MHADRLSANDGEVCVEVSVTGASDKVIQSENWKKISVEMEAWREAFTVQMAMDFAIQNTKQNKQIKKGESTATCKLQTEPTELQLASCRFTVAVLCSGGCLDTLAAMRCGVVLIWSTETNVAKAAMWCDLTKSVSLGDTFCEAVLIAERPDYLKSGQPCPDYSFASSQRGEDGATGWMFTKQVEIIKAVLPRCFCLEISDNAVNVNGGREVRKVKAQLGVRYIIYCKKLAVWRYGDASNRKRLFMVGFHIELGQAAREFRWPDQLYDEDRVPIARCVAVEDCDVPKRYWRRGVIPITADIENEGAQHKLQFIARTGVGMGPSWLPNAVLSWSGLLNG